MTEDEFDESDNDVRRYSWREKMPDIFLVMILVIIAVSVVVFVVYRERNFAKGFRSDMRKAVGAEQARKNQVADASAVDGVAKPRIVNEIHPVTNVIEKRIDVTVERKVTNYVNEVVKVTNYVTKVVKVTNYVDKVVDVVVLRTNRIERQVNLSSLFETKEDRPREVNESERLVEQTLSELNDLELETGEVKPVDAPPVTNVVERRVEVFIDKPVTNVVERKIDVKVVRMVTNFVDRPVEVVVDRPVTNVVDRPVEVAVDRFVTNWVDRLVTVNVDRFFTNVVEHPVEVTIKRPVTNVVERKVDIVVERPVTNFIDRIVDVPVDRFVTNLVQRPVNVYVDVPVTNIVERQIEVVTTNEVRRPVVVYVERPVTNYVERKIQVSVDRPVRTVARGDKESSVRRPQSTPQVRAQAAARVPQARRQMRLSTPYRVKSGDTVGALAKRYGFRMPDFQVCNPYVDVNRISVGQVLYLPGNVDVNP